MILHQNLFLTPTCETLFTATASRSPGMKERKKWKEFLESVENKYGRVSPNWSDVGQHMWACQVQTLLLQLHVWTYRCGKKRCDYPETPICDRAWGVLSLTGRFPYQQPCSGCLACFHTNSSYHTMRTELITSIITTVLDFYTTLIESINQSINQSTNHAVNCSLNVHNTKFWEAGYYRKGKEKENFDI